MSGTNPYPIRFGGSKDSLYAVLLDSLQEAMGDGFSVDDDAMIAAELVADSRALSDLFLTNQRLANQWDPDRMTDFLARWEAIYGLSPTPDMSDNQRRVQVKLKRQAIGRLNNNSSVYDLLVEVLGDAFVSLTPGNPSLQSSQIPGGLVIPGGATLKDGAYSSHVAQIFVHVEKPDSMSALEFAEAKAQVGAILNSILPAWTNWTLYQNSSDGIASFKLDEPNLDIEALT